MLGSPSRAKSLASRGMARSRLGRGAGEDVTQAAQRRLELLRRELAQAGVLPTAERGSELRPPADVLPEDLPQGLPEVVPAVVPESGRHARRRRPGLGSQASGWLADRMPPTLQGRVHLGASQAALVAVLAAVGLAVAAVVVLRSGSGGGAVPVGGSRPSTARPLVSAAAAAAPVGSPTAGPSPAADATGPSAVDSAGVVVVDVAGKVRHPGVATLPAGSRVVDAIRRAGGARRGADLTGLNLARVLVDGEQVLVGVSAPPGLAASAAATSTAGAAPGQLVNINTADVTTLETLPDVGPVTAQKILDWRTAHGSFSSVDELLEVDGIGEKTLADMAPFVTL